MFGNDPSQDEDDEGNDFWTDPFGDTSQKEDPLDGGRLPWEELSEGAAEQLEQKTETPMCKHDDAREVITKQSGAGVNIAGTGSSVTQTVTKVVCPVCGGEWNTRDGSGNRDYFGL